MSKMRDAAKKWRMSDLRILTLKMVIMILGVTISKRTKIQNSANIAERLLIMSAWSVLNAENK